LQIKQTFNYICSIKLNKRLNKLENTETKQVDKREHIMEVAEVLFAQFGFEAVSIREISKEAKINIAMVSYYFGSKDKLYEAVVTRKLINSNSILKQIELQKNYTEKLFAIVDLYIEQFSKNRYFQNIIFRELAMGQRTEMTEHITTILFENFSIITSIIQQGIKIKEFKKVDAELTVLTIIGVIKIYMSSGTIACKILQKNDVNIIFEQKQKMRLKKYLKELLINQLGIN
jgi:AcrR family transcriptional regulator